MDVYLVPVGRDRYECYYEAPEEEDEEEPADGQGFFARLRTKFNEQLKEAERARHQRAIDEPKTILGRIHKRSLRWIAERIAEQRLLWHLRRTQAATLHVPADLPLSEADSILRSSMKRDADFHRNRLIPHSIALVAAGAIAFIPGPNVLGYLFTFTVVGHFLSWRGAVHALHRVDWTVVPNDDLHALHRAFSGTAADRHRIILEVAERLHMPKMALFVERMTAPSA